MKSILLVLLVPFIVFAETEPAKEAAETKFNNESELSLIQTGGNSTVETYNGKTKSTWTKGKRIYSFGGHYTLGYSEVTDDTTGDDEKKENVRNWDVNGRYEQVLSKSINGFSAVKYEGDEFSGYKQRENLDIGLKYIISNTDTTKSSFELGARYTIEKSITRDEDNEDVFNYTKARMYYEVTYTQSKTVVYKFWTEYLPNFTESDDYLVTYEPSVALALSNTFSLKTSYKAVYDNQPNIEGNENTDYTFTTSLLAKF